MESDNYEDFVKNDVTNYIIGLCALNPSLACFNFGNVIIRRDYNEISSPRLISGGSSGFEPGFSGFVGKGMLTAAIQGDLYTAPPSKLILRTIRELSVGHYGGILIIIQGNSGDSLNFGLAKTRALADKLKCKILVVSEDCNNNLFPKIKQRGLTGVILIQKIAGAMSESDVILTDIYNYCSICIENLSSNILCLNYDALKSEEDCICKKEIFKDEAEIGRGLQGEAPVKRIKLSNNKEMIIEILSNILEAKKIKENDSCIILLNNIGKITKFNELILVNDTINVFKEKNIKIVRFYTGSFLTTNTYQGITLTVLKLFDERLLEYLDYPCEAPAWKNVVQKNPELTVDNFIMGSLRRKKRLSPIIQGPNLSCEASHIVNLSINFACDALISCEKQLNLIDSEKGDGDTGTRLRRTAEVILKRMKNKKLTTNNPFNLLGSLSRVLEACIGGTMGCIYSILFESASKTFAQYADDEPVKPSMWLKAFATAVKDFKTFSGSIELGGNTMYDPLHVCLDTLNENWSEENFLAAFEKAVYAAEICAQKTVQENYRHPDSGAHAVGIWLRAVFESVKLRC